MIVVMKALFLRLSYHSIVLQIDKPMLDEKDPIYVIIICNIYALICAGGVY